MIQIAVTNRFEKEREREPRFTSRSPEAQNGTSHYENADDTIKHAVETWLIESYPPTSGESTAIIYRKIITSLRSYLQSQNLDLDSPSSQLTQQIQAWANLRKSTRKHLGNVAPSTYNQRIAAINSFYSWVSKRGSYAWSNPVDQLSRSAVCKYADAQALDIQQVRSQLKKIDRSTARGQRDYALLQVALNTGRSARELANLSLGSLSLQGEYVTLTFEGGRGGKVMCDTLDSRLTQTLLDYLGSIYGEDLSVLSPLTPIWISFSDRTYRQAIGHQTIADICEMHLGVSSVHRLRHTFALTMDQLGAPSRIIQTRLGHENRATTDAYLARLKGAHNPYASLLADAFGVE